MPTTVPLAFREAETELLRDKSPATARNADLLAIVAFAAIGLALTIGFAVLFSVAADPTTGSNASLSANRASVAEPAPATFDVVSGL